MWQPWLHVSLEKGSLFSLFLTYPVKTYLHLFLNHLQSCSLLCHKHSFLFYLAKVVRDIHQSHKILTTGLHFAVMDLLRGFKVLQKKKIFLKGREGKEMGDTALIPTRRDGKSLSIPGWICTCKNPILYDKQHNLPVLHQFSPGGNNRDWHFQVKLKIIATAFFFPLPFMGLSLKIMVFSSR